ncbi:putative F-box/LRR-repeat protein 23 [Panicum virgatum]|uniref:putative F-box/LRR-repeat protein 23 n=1 Tax=Panicum virgatum TaxID=38727 RepID=UPI0019D4F096|nr:putative F-box/LRR-repeat protein 23 [Panicum virgatum]
MAKYTSVMNEPLIKLLLSFLFQFMFSNNIHSTMHLFLSPRLRSLRLISCNDVTDIGFTEAVKALPLLEELELSLCGNVGADGVYEVGELFGNHLSNKGLETILDNCPHLECLDIRQCLNIDMNETLLEKCSRIKTIKLPAYPTDDYDLKVESPGTRSPVRTNARYTDP